MTRDFDDGSAQVGTSGMLAVATILEKAEGKTWLAQLATSGERVACAVLHGSAVEACVAEGAAVVVAFPDDARTRGFILGVISPAPLAREGLGSDPAEGGSEAPDYLVLEARKGLTLKVGDGSITIREDGRILIKGRDLVSHAKGMNRIRGGSVSIN